jgi:hypothetical protein
MNLRELFEAGAVGALARPLVNKAVKKAAEKEVGSEVGAVALPRVKAQARAISNAQEKEETNKVSAAFCFGRFNPAHQGHAGVWDEVSKSGHKWYIGTNPTTIGPDDPLSFDVKSAWMEAIDPKIKGHIVGEKSVVTLASKIYADIGEGHYVNYVTDQTDWAWSGKLLKQYNGVKGPHGYYNFKDVLHVESPRVTSATDLRNAARAGDEKLFYELSGTNPNLTVHGKHYFETVAEACGQHPEKVKKSKSIKEVNQQIRDKKRAVAEAKSHGEYTALDNDVDRALPGVWVQRELRNTDPYMQYRYGLALAAARADAAGHVNFKQESPWAENLTLVGFVPEDEDVIKAADKLLGVKGTRIADQKSLEPSDTYKTSAVANIKKNQYGI